MGTPFLVQDGINGIITEPGDAGAIATALEQLRTDSSLRDRMRQAGRERICDEFAMEHMVSRYEEL
jgi:glycosyltransferase involved in cell wall biosynthesis